MSAVISDCGRYRYRLERHGLSGAGAIAWIMVNPSMPIRLTPTDTSYSV